jgi:hypothetical protein
MERLMSFLDMENFCQHQFLILIFMANSKPQTGLLKYI